MNVGDWVVGVDCGDDSLPGRVEWMGGADRSRVIVNKLDDLRLHDAKDLRVVHGFQPGSYVRLIGANAAENRCHGRVQIGRNGESVGVVWPDGHIASYSKASLVPDRPIPHDAEWREALKWLSKGMRVRRKSDGKIFTVDEIGIRKGLVTLERFVRMQHEVGAYTNPSAFEPAPVGEAPDSDPRPSHVTFPCTLTIANSYERAEDDAGKELLRAVEAWPPFNSAHEGLAVLQEEVKELADHVYTNQKKRDLGKMRKEALQVAAMAIRFAAEVCDESRGRK